MIGHTSCRSPDTRSTAAGYDGYSLHSSPKSMRKRSLAAHTVLDDSLVRITIYANFPTPDRSPAVTRENVGFYSLGVHLLNDWRIDSVDPIGL
jgi:hypothetical protein